MTPRGRARPISPRIAVVTAEGERTGSARTLVRRVLTTGVGLAGIAAVVVFLDPARVATALRHFNVLLIAPILGLSLIAYLLQGLRWHYLLRDIGVRLSLRDTVLVNLAGQTITAIVPLGDLTRAAFAAAAGDADFGAVAATVTVQELSYTLILMLSALPAILALGYGLAALIPTALGIAFIVASLTVSPLFHVLHGAIAHVPLLNRLLPAIDELQQETAALLHRPDTLLLSVLDAARVVVSITAFWCIVTALTPGHVGWWQAAFVLALSTIGGAVSLVPGGVGANEASVAALLIFLGVDYGSAGAVAIIQRTLITGLSLGLGFASYTAIRRRLHLGGLFQVFARRPDVAVDAPAKPLVHSGLT